MHDLAAFVERATEPVIDYQTVNGKVSTQRK